MGSRSVLITGASSGIGRALALEFAGRGDRVTGIARNRVALRSVAKSITTRGGHCTMIPCDVRKEGQVRRAVRKGLSRGAAYDVLINNAGITSFREFTKTSAREFTDILDSTVKGSMLVTRHVLPGMLRRRSGTIVNVISYAAKTVYTNSSAYSAAKAGLDAMMNVLREEVRTSNIRIINVYPGAVLTPMWPEPLRKKFRRKMIPPPHLARLIYEMTHQPHTMTVEELVIRPPTGDLRI